jgi:AraC family transcriptional regulator, transcriptional activator of pobA
MPRRTAAQPFPQYFLYGEASQDVDERFLHVESIAARSRLHDWTIRPHAHRDLHHLLLVLRGGGVYTAEGAARAFAAPALLSVPLACVHSFDFRPGTDGWIVTASGALVGRIVREHAELAGVFKDASAIALPAAALEPLKSPFEALIAEFRGQLPGRKTAAEAALTTILVHAWRRQLEALPAAARPRSADAVLVGRFRTLVEANFREQTSIADYARRLAVSQERLRTACVRSAGSSPLVLLNARRLLEAKRSLLYTNMSVALIAETCGFLDPAYFSRFFAHSTGKSPRNYRLKGPSD